MLPINKRVTLSLKNIVYFKGDQITEAEAKRRSTKYKKNGQGCFIYHGVKDVFGKSIWYV